MKIELKLFTSLRKNRDKKYQFDIQPGSTPADLSELADIDPREVKMVLINGRVSSIDAELKEGDSVSFFPVIGGG